jgi:hypothetical protein
MHQQFSLQDGHWNFQETSQVQMATEGTEMTALSSTIEVNDGASTHLKPLKNPIHVFGSKAVGFNSIAPQRDKLQAPCSAVSCVNERYVVPSLHSYTIHIKSC